MILESGAAPVLSVALMEMGAAGLGWHQGRGVDGTHGFVVRRVLSSAHRDAGLHSLLQPFTMQRPGEFSHLWHPWLIHSMSPAPSWPSAHHCQVPGGLQSTGSCQGHLQAACAGLAGLSSSQLRRDAHTVGAGNERPQCSWGWGGARGQPLVG